MKPRFRLVHIDAIEELSAHMRRIVFAGDALLDFPSGYEGAHIKVIVPEQGETMPNLVVDMRSKKQMRSYTVRAFDAVYHRLTVDFAVNDHRGLVADWALTAKVGDRVGIGGPGPIKYTNLNADWHLFVGDLTSLPAIAATLEKLPRHAVGHAILQVPTEGDKQVIKAPANVTITWVIDANPLSGQLLAHVAKVSWLAGSPQVFIAAESSQMKAIHAYVKGYEQYQTKNAYVSGYWKAS